MTTISTNQQVEYLGVAITDKAENSRELQVYCPELLPFMQGELKGMNQAADIHTTNGSKTYQSQVTTSNAIRCIYRGTDANRLLPPDVRKGEQVIVTSYGDTNIFYWREAGVDGNTRRTETYRIGVGDTLNSGATLDDSNCHYVELDSRRHNHIKLITAQSNGETFGYTLVLSPELNKVILGDTDGNSVVLDSTVPSITLSNKKGSIVDINDENIIIACNKNITIESKSGEITMHAAKNITAMADKDMNLTSGQKMGHTSGSDYTVNSSATLTLQSSSTMTLSAGGGLNMSFVGSGSCSSSGGNMTFTMSQMNINKG